MIARKPRAALFATILALLALLNVGALSTWHGASVHDDHAIASTADGNVHNADQDEDAENAIHVVAHAVGQAFALPTDAAAKVVVEFDHALWPIAITSRLASLSPPSLLRPPRK